MTTLDKGGQAATRPSLILSPVRVGTGRCRLPARGAALPSDGFSALPLWIAAPCPWCLQLEPAMTICKGETKGPARGSPTRPQLPPFPARTLSDGDLIFPLASFRRVMH